MCGGSLEERVPLCMARFYRNTPACLSCACARIPPQSTHTYTTLSASHCFTHKHTPACILILMILSHLKQPPLETTNKVSYLPLVPALFCQVTSFVSFLLFASLTLFLPLPLSLFLCFSPSLTLPSLSLHSLSLLLSFGGQAWLLGLFPGFFFPQKVTMVLSPPLLGSGPVRFNHNSFWKTTGLFHVSELCHSLLL